MSAPGRTRTCDQPLRRRLLYPLSYGGSAPTLTELTDSLRCPITALTCHQKPRRGALRRTSVGTDCPGRWEEQQRWQGGRSHERRGRTGRCRAPRRTQPCRSDPAPRRSQPAHALGDHDAGGPRHHAGLGTPADPVRARVAQGSAAAAEGRDADAAHGRATMGDRPRLQPRLPRPSRARLRTRHAARGARPGGGRAAVAARHLAAAVDRDARRGSCRWPGRDDGASQPCRHRRRRRRRDVRQPLRPRARPAA